MFSRSYRQVPLRAAPTAPTAQPQPTHNRLTTDSESSFTGTASNRTANSSDVSSRHGSNRTTRLHNCNCHVHRKNKAFFWRSPAHNRFLPQPCAPSVKPVILGPSSRYGLPVQWDGPNNCRSAIQIPLLRAPCIANRRRSPARPVATDKTTAPCHPYCRRLHARRICREEFTLQQLSVSTSARKQTVVQQSVRFKPSHAFSFHSLRETVRPIHTFVQSQSVCSCHALELFTADQPRQEKLRLGEGHGY